MMRRRSFIQTMLSALVLRPSITPPVITESAKAVSLTASGKVTAIGFTAYTRARIREERFMRQHMPIDPIPGMSDDEIT